MNMTKTKTNQEVILRATGLLVIEVNNSNPNGDPDRDSDPRQRPDKHGEISPVSFKRKLRDLVEDKGGFVWKELFAEESGIDPERFYVLETRGRVRETIKEELKDDNGSKFTSKYWDGRVFGNTFLEEGSSTSIKTGVVQFGLGVSVAPVEIERSTNTSKAGVQEGKDRGMAPMGYRIVRHGIYCMPFFVNPSMAHKTGCIHQDIEVLKKVIPYAYSHTRSHIRPNVELLRAWYIEHKNPLGSCPDYMLIDALTPKKTSEPDKQSKNRSEYEIPAELPAELKNRVQSCVDLVNQ
jgi:Cas7 group CRISPR-associated protein Csh2